MALDPWLISNMSRIKKNMPPQNGLAVSMDRAENVIDFDRALCSDLSNAERREWLVTNGMGGFASGTVAGVRTRRYHGLLVAALRPPLGRTLLVSKFDETLRYGGNSYTLSVNRWNGDIKNTPDPLWLDRFHLEGTVPVWTYICADALLEKRIWMEQGANTTYVQYALKRASGAVAVDLKALVNYRDYHSNTHAGEWRMSIDSIEKGIQVTAFDGAIPFFIRSEQASVKAVHEWYHDYFLRLEAYRGLSAVEDNLKAAVVETDLEEGDAITIVLSTEEDAELNGQAAYARRRAYEKKQLGKAGLQGVPAEVNHLVLAADQFIVTRSTPEVPDGRSILAGFPWFSDWGRDTMIALPGLTICTGRTEVAAGILRIFAHYVDQGMIPNRFPDAGEVPEYNTIDATLWYFEAIRAYYEATGDEKLLEELFPVLESIIDWHQKGTRYQIRVDETDSLLYGGEPGVQLTWMDAKVGDWVVTPRIGKPVEINALWYHALRVMEAFARQLEKPYDAYREVAERVETGFSRFWNQETNYCYDVLDSPEGNDARLRPNQLIAVSLTHSPLSAEQKKAIVDVCAQRLYTPHGMRSLDESDAAFVSKYGGGPWERDGAYHQGTVWSWLIGPFVEAHLRVYNDAHQARSYIEPLLRHMADHGLGSISEIFDGTAPYTPRGCFAQAWGVAELLRVWALTDKQTN